MSFTSVDITLKDGRHLIIRECQPEEAVAFMPFDKACPARAGLRDRAFL